MLRPSKITRNFSQILKDGESAVIRIVRGSVDPSLQIVPTDKSSPLIDFNLKNQLQDLITKPDDLSRFYGSLSKSARARVCDQLDLWSRDVSNFGPENSWRIVSMLIKEPEIMIRKSTISKVASAVIHSRYTLRDDKIAATAALRALDHWNPLRSMVLPARPKFIER